MSCDCFPAVLDAYKELDNSPADYDPREGHLLLARDVDYDSPSQVSYQGEGSQALITRLLLDESSSDGFFEEHFILDDEKYHILTISPQKGACTIEARHWNRLTPEIAQRQLLKFGHREKVAVKSNPSLMAKGS